MSRAYVSPDPQKTQIILPIPPILPSFASKKNSPVGPLLVQHAVPALLAADGVALLQCDLVVAVAAQVVYRARRVFEAAARGLEACVDGACGAAAGAAEIGLAGASRGGLVLFAGHCGVCVCWRRGWVGGFVVRWAGWRWNLNFLLSARESESRILKQASLLGSARECSGRCRGRGEGFDASSC